MIYDCKVSDTGVADIKMTLTAPSCPVAGILPGQVEATVRAVPGITDVKVELVWDPPWDRDKMSDAAKLSLGFDLGFDVVSAAQIGKMKLTAHEEYGFRCLVQIGKSGPLTIPEISEAEGISPSYTAKLLRTLRQGGFITSARGKVGGYSLARPANGIVVGEVLAALGGKMFEKIFAKAMPGRRKFARIPRIVRSELCGIACRALSTKCSGRLPYKTSSAANTT